MKMKNVNNCNYIFVAHLKSFINESMSRVIVFVLTLFRKLLITHNDGPKAIARKDTRN